MRKSKLWKKLLDVEHVVLEDADVEEAPGGSEIAVIRLRPDRGAGCAARNAGRGAGSTMPGRGGGGGGRWTWGCCGASWRRTRRG